MIKIVKKLGIGGALALFGLLVVGAAFATFTITQFVSSNNSVTAASAGLQVTNSPMSVSGLVEGGSTPNNPLTIKNIGQYSGNVKLNIINTTGLLCPDLTLTVSGDASGSASPLANGSIDLGTLAPGATLNLVQVVSMKDSSTNLGQPCTWSETATLSGN